MFSWKSLTQARKTRGLTQEELARQSTLSVGTVSKLEEGRITNPKASTLTKLASVLDCTIDSLLDITPNS